MIPTSTAPSLTQDALAIATAGGEGDVDRNARVLLDSLEPGVGHCDVDATSWVTRRL